MSQTRSSLFLTRRDALRTLALILGATAMPGALGFLGASARAASPSPSASPAGITSTSLGGKLNLITGAGGNIAVLDGVDGALVIDSGLVNFASKIVAEVGKAGPLALLVNTHWHHDHTGGNENLAKVGARIMAHDNCRKRLSTDQFSEALGVKLPAAPPAGRPSITISDETGLHLNEEEIRLMPVPPAHTDGDLIVRFEKADLIHAGDLFFNGMYPYFDYSSGGWIGGVVSAIKTLSGMTNAKTRIIPGHGPLATTDDLKGYHAFLETIFERLGKLKTEGRNVDDALAAKPTKEFDEKLGKGFFTPEQFVRITYTGLLKHG